MDETISPRDLWINRAHQIVRDARLEPKLAEALHALVAHLTSPPDEYTPAEIKSLRTTPAEEAPTGAPSLGTGGAERIVPRQDALPPLPPVYPNT